MKNDDSRPQGYPETPTLDKRSEVQEDSNTIGEFLDWLGEQGIALCKVGVKGYSANIWPDHPSRQHPRLGSQREKPDYLWGSTDGETDSPPPVSEDRVTQREVFQMISEGPSQLLHRYFEIDPKAEDREMQAVLEHVRTLNVSEGGEHDED